MKGNKPKYRSRKPQNSKKEFEENREPSIKEGLTVKPNDAEWYIVSDQILNDVARIPYNIPVGMPFSRYGTFQDPNVLLQAYDDALPGLMASYVMPCLGNAHSASDPVNVAANSVYQFVRSRISGSRNYEAVDMMIYLGAMDSLFCFVTWLTRLYSTVFTYHSANRYLAKALVEAQHIDYDDLVSNLAQFRSGVNMRIAKVRALYLPSILPIFKRHTWMFSNYYIEGPSEKDQIYFHVPEGIYNFMYDSTGKGMLHAYRLDDSLPNFTVAQLFLLLDSMIDPIYQDEDFNRISGDFLKAYEGNVFTLSELPDITTVSLIYNEEVLEQFHNAKYRMVAHTGDHFYGDFFDYAQDPTGLYLIGSMDPSTNAALDCFIHVNTAGNNITSAIITSSSAANEKSALAAVNYEWSKSTMLTSKDSDVDAKTTMTNTRLTLSANISADSSSFWSGKFDRMNFGTEWPIRYSIVTFHRDRVTHVISTFRRWYDRCIHVAIANTVGIQQLFDSQLPIRTAFKYLPELSILLTDSNDQTYNPGRNYFEVDNYALPDATTISGLHDAAILGEYNIPGLAIGH